MAKSKSPMNGHVRTGFVKTQGKFTAEYQREILKAAGVTRIVDNDESKDQDLKYALSLLRGDEVLETVDGFRPLGPGRYTITGELEILSKSGRVIMDCKTGLRSDRDGALMLSRALAKELNKRLGPSRADAQKRGRKGAAARWADKDRMPPDEARAIWKDTKIPKKKKLKLMWGWSESTAYRYFEETGLPPGRR
jgi:hypothetical protein